MSGFHLLLELGDVGHVKQHHTLAGLCTSGTGAPVWGFSVSWVSKSLLEKRMRAGFKRTQKSEYKLWYWRLLPSSCCTLKAPSSIDNWFYVLKPPEGACPAVLRGWMFPGAKQDPSSTLSIQISIPGGKISPWRAFPFSQNHETTRVVSRGWNCGTSRGHLVLSFCPAWPFVLHTTEELAPSLWRTISDRLGPEQKLFWVWLQNQTTSPALVCGRIPGLSHHHL